MQTPVVLGTSVNLGTNTAGTTVSFGTVSVGANKPIVLAVLQATYGGAPNAITPDPSNTLGMTWTTHVNNVVHSDIGSASLHVFTGIKTSAVSGDLTFGVAATSAVARTIAIAADMGADGNASPPPIVQVSDVLQEGSESPSDATVAGLEALASGSGVLAVFSTPGAASPVFTPQNSFTQLAQVNATDGALIVIYKLAGTTDPRVTTDDDFVRVNGFAFEIKADGGGSTSQAPRSMHQRRMRHA